MKERFLIISALNPWNAHIIEIDSDNLLQGFYKEIMCDYIEVAYMPSGPLRPPEGIIMVVDESGWLKENPIQNHLATVLCHQPIAGNVIFARSGFRDGEPDIVGLTDADVQWFKYHLAI